MSTKNGLKAFSRVDPGLGAGGWVISQEPLLTAGEGGLQGLVAAGEILPTPPPSISGAATLGVTLHLSTAGKWLWPAIADAVP